MSRWRSAALGEAGRVGTAAAVLAGRIATDIAGYRPRSGQADALLVEPVPLADERLQLPPRSAGPRSMPPRQWRSQPWQRSGLPRSPLERRRQQRRQ